MQSTILKQSTAENLEKFRKDFTKVKKCYVSEKQDFVSYSYDHNAKLAYSDWCRAKKVIEELKLPLVALYTYGNDSFHVQSCENSDI